MDEFLPADPVVSPVSGDPPESTPPLPDLPPEPAPVPPTAPREKPADGVLLAIGLSTVAAVGVVGFVIGRATAPAPKPEVKLTVAPTPQPTQKVFPSLGPTLSDGSREFREPDGVLSFKVPSTWTASPQPSTEYQQWSVTLAPGGLMTIRYYPDPGLMMAECVTNAGGYPRAVGAVPATASVHLPPTGGAICEGVSNPPGELWIQSADPSVPFGFSVSFTARESQYVAQQILDALVATIQFSGRRMAVTPTPSPLPVSDTWKTFTPAYSGLKFRYPGDWKADDIENKTSGEHTVSLTGPGVGPGTVTLTVKPSWEGTGNADTLPRTYRVGTGIPAARFDPPKKTDRQLDRYQTNVYWKYGTKVYVFGCNHGWNADTLGVCERILSSVAP